VENDCQGVAAVDLRGIDEMISKDISIKVYLSCVSWSGVLFFLG